MVNTIEKRGVSLDLNLKLKHVKKFLLSIFIIFLPFGQALTINLFFPLKISEIAIILFVALLFAESLFNLSSSFNLDKVSSIIVLFTLIVLFSTIVNFFKSFPYELDLSNVRTSKNVDSFLKFFYLILASVSMRMTYISVLRYGKEVVLKWFFLGAIIASSYSWYLSISSALSIPYIALPGMDPVPQNLNLSFGRVIRCGTFKEGNYMGLFLFIAGVLAMYSDKKKLTAFFFITILTTFSTISFVCLAVYLFLNVLKSNGSKIKAAISLGFLIILIGILITKSEDFRTNVINKIFVSEDAVKNTNDVVSRLDRLNTTQIGLQIFVENPFWGVGPANYGLHFFEYNAEAQFGEGDYKRIPNNIYVEILSESGIFAFLLFLTFIVLLMRKTIKIRAPSVYFGMILTFIYLLSFPTYTILYLWFFWGFVVSEQEIIQREFIVD